MSDPNSDEIVELETESDSKAESEDDAPTQCNDDELELLRERILIRLARALDGAAERFGRAASGRSEFSDATDLKAMLALLDLLPLIMAQLEPKARPFVYTGIPLIPKCPICGQGPGAHWPGDCPQNPEPDPEKRRRNHFG